MKKNPKDLPLQERKPSIVRSILFWYSRCARDLPWRGEKNSYRILVSEIMLQQTQVNRVIQLYPRYLKRFPDFRSLARARTSSVIRAWRGLGYNNRAIRLQSIARVVQKEYKGRLPETIVDLQMLPGIGKYSAHAIACLAFNQNVPVVDVNVQRVLSRLFPKESRCHNVWELATLALPKRNAGIWNQALMDLGSTICTAANPKCDVCPVAGPCPSSFSVTRIREKREKIEPSRDGLPNRIYRGRIVEALRHHPSGKSILISRLGARIKGSYSARDERWLVQLMMKLEKDGLVALKNSKSGMAASLPR